MTSTGKKARKTGGDRFACKRGRKRSPRTKTFGSLPYSYRDGKGNSASFKAVKVARCDCAAGCPGISGGQCGFGRRHRFEDRMNSIFEGAA
jgi:hypothetical protein